MHLPCYRFGPAFNSKLAGVVESVTRKADKTSKGGNVEDQPASMVFGLTHDFNSTHRDAHGAEEQRLHLLMHLFLGCRLGIAREGVAGIVDHDIEMEVLAEVLLRSSKSSLDGSDRGHVQSKFEDVGISIREVGEAGRVASCGNEALVGLACDQFSNGFTDARGTTGDFSDESQLFA